MKWLTFMMVAIVGFGFVSCGDDDDGPVFGPGAAYTGGGSGSSGGGGNTPSNSELVNQLQGTWKFNKGTETVEMPGLPSTTVNVDYTMLGTLKSQLQQQTGSRVEFWDETLTFNGSTLNNVKFTVNGQKINLEGIKESDGISVSVKSITESTLVLHEVFDLEEFKITADMEYKKQ